MTAANALSEYERALIANVREHGCQSTYVLAEPPFGYSIGFVEMVAQPEVIVFGLSTETTGFVIERTLQKCLDGVVLDEGMLLEGILMTPLIVRSVAKEFILPQFLNSAMWYHQRVFGCELNSVVQLVWPNDDGIWPWEHGFPAELSHFQKSLYLGTLN